MHVPVNEYLCVPWDCFSFPFVFVSGLPGSISGGSGFGVLESRIDLHTWILPLVRGWSSSHWIGSGFASPTMPLIVPDSSRGISSVPSTTPGTFTIIYLFICRLDIQSRLMKVTRPIIRPSRPSISTMRAAAFSCSADKSKSPAGISMSALLVQRTPPEMMRSWYYVKTTSPDVARVEEPQASEFQSWVNSPPNFAIPK